MDEFLSDVELLAIFKQYEKMIEEKAFEVIGFVYLSSQYDYWNNNQINGKCLRLSEPYNINNQQQYETQEGDINFSCTVEYTVKVVEIVPETVFDEVCETPTFYSEFIVEDYIEKGLDEAYVSVTPVMLFSKDTKDLKDFYIQTTVEVDAKNFDFIRPTIHE